MQLLYGQRKSWLENGLRYHMCDPVATVGEASTKTKTVRACFVRAIVEL